MKSTATLPARNPPTLSVVIPCFNCERTLERCVESILRSAESCPQFREIILIDGGSSDATSALCARLARHGHPVRVLAYDRTSASAKRNWGWRNAKSDYIAFTDPDCIADEGWLARLAQAAGEGWPCVTGRVEPAREGLAASVRRAGQDKEFRPGLIHRAFPFRPGSSNNLMVAAEHLRDLGGFPEDLGPGTPNGVAEDTELLYLTLRKGTSVHYCAQAVVLHDEEGTMADFCRKKEGYGRGLAYFMLRRYRRDPAAWLCLLASYAYSALRLAGSAALLRRAGVRQAAAELKGRWSGTVLALRG